MSETSATLQDALRHVSQREPQVISARACAPQLVAAANGRFVVAVGTNLPNGTGLSAHLLDKGKEAPSLCRAIADADEAVFSELRANLVALDEHPLDRLLFVVKDASPDSLVAVLILLLKLRGIDTRTALSDWVASATTWDRGIMPEDPFRCWSALASSLSHANFPTAVTAQITDAQLYQRAWQRSFLFLVKSVADNLSPENMPSSLPEPGDQAIAMMKRLRQIYEGILAHAITIQLQLPLRDAPTRYLHVDALLYVEDEASDAAKLFGRHDFDNSPGRSGFAIAVSCRPWDTDWNRYTIYTDPKAGLDLTPLWGELERRETLKWRDGDWITRPAGAATPSRADFLAARHQCACSFDPDDLDRLVVRRGVARELRSVHNIWTNPWFLHPDASLIASPGRDADKAPADRSRLSWPEILETIWQTCHPLSFAKVRPYTGLGPDYDNALVQLLRAPTVCGDVAAQAPPHIRLLDWPPNAETVCGGTRAIKLTDSVVKALAALASRGAVTDSAAFAQLPPASAFRLVMLSGGFAVITHEGCLVIDDWNDPPLDREAMLAMLSKAATWRKTLDRQLSALSRINRALKRLTATARTDAAIHNLIACVIRKRATFAMSRLDMAAVTISDSNARVLYEEITAFWSSSTRETYVDQGYDELERSAKALQDSRASRLLKLISIYGFPASVAPNASRPLAATANAVLLSLGVQLPVSARMAEALLAGGEFLSWLFCTAILVLFARSLIRRWDPFKGRRSV